MRERKTIAFLLVAAFFGMNFQCTKFDAIRPFDHTFEMGVDIYPVKKTYRTTDTIWLETDATNKSLFDTQTNQLIPADTGKLTFSVTYYGFDAGLKDPPGSFADVIAFHQVNANRTVSPWNTLGYIMNFGCGEPSYRMKMGFKPNHKGTYSLIISDGQVLESCAGKVIPYHASVSYKYKTPGLNLDVLNTFSEKEKWNSNQLDYFTRAVNTGKCFVFEVE